MLTSTRAGRRVRDPLPLRDVLDRQFHSHRAMVRPRRICRYTQQRCDAMRASLVRVTLLSLPLGSSWFDRWLCWIRDAPTPVPGIIQGILPPLFLAILFAILPLLLKGSCRYS